MIYSCKLKRLLSLKNKTMYFYYISKVEELWNDFSINLIRINTFIQSFTISLAVFQS